MSEVVGLMGRALFRASVPGYFREGLSANEMVRRAIDLGYSYRRAVMLADIREISTGLRLGEWVRELASTVTPTRMMMNEVELRRAYNYRVFADITFRDPRTGEVTLASKSFYVNEVSSLGNMINDFEGAFGADYRTRNQYMIGGVVTQIQHNVGFEY